MFPQTGKTGCYRPECPSSKWSEGQLYQKIARIKTTSGNLWCFSCIVSQLALSYPNEQFPFIQRRVPVPLAGFWQQFFASK